MISYPLLTWLDLDVLKKWMVKTNENTETISSILLKQQNRIAELEVQVAKLSRRRKKS